MAKASPVVVTEVRKPSKGVRPHFEGVPGRLVELPEGLRLGLVFGKKRVSPYDALLLKLAASAPGFVLEFESTRAAASVKVRAKSLDLKVELAQAQDGSGKLYVRLAPVLEEQRTNRRAAIVALLAKSGPQSTMKIAVALREKGDTTLDAGQVGPILEQMALLGMVVKRDGGEWGLSTKAAGR